MRVVVKDDASHRLDPKGLIKTPSFCWASLLNIQSLDANLHKAFTFFGKRIILTLQPLAYYF